MRIISTLFLLSLLASCGSTPKQISEAQLQHIESPTIKKMVKMNILELKFADEIVRIERDRRNQQNNELKNTAFAVATDNGTLIGGYLVSNLLGGGASIGDIFSVGNLLLSGIPDKRNVEQHHRTYAFIEVGQNCNEKCARTKLMEIGLKYLELGYKQLQIPFPKDASLTLPGTTYTMFGFHFFELLDGNNEIVTSSRRSEWHKINVNSTNRPQNQRAMIANNLEFFEIGEKRYYGSNPANKESDLVFYGAHGLEFDDNTEHLIELSKLYPELFVYKPKVEYTKRIGNENVKYCVGNSIIEKGSVELVPQMYGCSLFHYPPKTL